MVTDLLINTVAAYVFVHSVLGENILTDEFGMISAETNCWDMKRNSQIFNKDFYLPLYLPLCRTDIVAGWPSFQAAYL
jgi:hypothetical protein